MATNGISATAADFVLTINGFLFDNQVPLECFRGALGPPSSTIDPGPPAPYGHRNNQIHVFGPDGIYLTEHHTSRLIESVNFVFDPSESPFPIESAFCGDLYVGGQRFGLHMSEADLDSTLFTRDLPGENSVKYKKCWVGVSAKGPRGRNGKRSKRRYVVRVSVCF